MSALAKTLTELDGLTAIIEELREMREETKWFERGMEWADKARFKLETLAVHLEDKDEATFTEPKELQFCKNLVKNYKILITDDEYSLFVENLNNLELADFLIPFITLTDEILKPIIKPIIKSGGEVLKRVILHNFNYFNTEDYMSALFIQVSVNGTVEMVDWLLQDPRVDPCFKENLALWCAVKYNTVEVVDRLLKHPKINPSDKQNIALRSASVDGNAAMVRLLIHGSRVDPSDCDNNAIQLASQHGHIEVVKLLLHDTRVDPTANDNYAIRSASANGHVAVVELLKAHGCVLPS